jgi:hypothetical protein
MLRCRLISLKVLLVCLILFSSGCKKNPITATIPLGQETIVVVCSPASASPGSSITIALLIAGNGKEIRVFGLDMDYDSQMFEFQSADKGDLNSSWTAVDGNAFAAGTIKVGGYAGEGNPVAVGSNGALALVKLRVTGDQYGDGQKSQIRIKQYTDDIAGFSPESAYAVFTLDK